MTHSIRTIFLVGLCLAPIIAAPLIAKAQDEEATFRTEIEVGTAYDQLSSGYSDWRESYVELLQAQGKEKTALAQIRQATRFDLIDTELMVGVFHHISPTTVAVAEGRTSSPGDVLPRRTFAGSLQQILGVGWILHGGLRHVVYPQSWVDMLVLKGERYFSDYRAGYTLHYSRLDNIKSATNHSADFSIYYGKSSTATVIFSQGRAIERVSPTRVESFETTETSIWGRHWLNGEWAIRYGVSSFRQGNLYTRTGWMAGVRLRY